MSGNKRINRGKWYYFFKDSTLEEILSVWAGMTPYAVSRAYRTYKDSPLFGHKVCEAQRLRRAGDLVGIMDEFLSKNKFNIDSLIMNRKQSVRVTCHCGYSWKTQIYLLLREREGSACRECSGRKYSRDSLETNLLCKLKEEKDKFNGWVGKAAVMEKLRMVCPDHGEYNPSYDSFIRQGSRCPGCSKPGFKHNLPSVVYLFKIYKGSRGFCGYGITGNFKKRLVDHKCKLKKENFEVKVYKSWEMSGYLAQKIEKEILKNFPKFSQKVTGFKREATYLRHYTSIIKLVDRMIADAEIC